VRRLETDVDLFHLHTPLPPPIHSRRPVLLTVHSMMLADARARRTDSAFELSTKLLSPLSQLIEMRLLRLSQIITAVSRVAADHARDCLPQGSKVVTMWNGVDPCFFLPDRRIEADPNRLLFVGRLAPGKGVEDLIKALPLVIAQYPKVKLYIAGNGPLKGRVKSRIKHSGLKQHVRLLGHIDSRVDLRTLYQKAWTCILPSHHESLPTVVLEAMACGIPVVATHVGSVPDVVTDGVSGVLVPPRSPERLAEAICRLLNDAALRARMGAAARRTTEKHFAWQTVGSAYLRCYQALLNEANV
jgi:glycosyltransferase involved in cell wall biosynthesis